MKEFQLRFMTVDLRLVRKQLSPYSLKRKRDWAFVAHAIAQNAHHQTDTGLPVRHASLNSRAPAVQTDVLDGFL
jgi:hypothetical protein